MDVELAFYTYCREKSALSKLPVIRNVNLKVSKIKNLKPSIGSLNFQPLV